MTLIFKFSYLKKPFKMRTVPKLTQKQINKRYKFARWWRREANMHKKLPMMFSDEKIFCVIILYKN